MSPSSAIRLDLNNPTFQSQLFDLPKGDQRAVLNTLRKLSRMSWEQLYRDRGLKWEAILSKRGPHGGRLYTFRCGKGFRAVAYRHGDLLRLLTLHPGQDSAYR